MNAADTALESANFQKCQSKACAGNKKLSYVPTPPMHLHFTESEWLDLYRRSDILWRLPNLSNVNGESIVLASDPNNLPGPDMLGGRGRLQPDWHPVRVPSVSQLVQTLMLLAKKDEDTYGGYRLNLVSYILELCTEHGVFDRSQPTGSYQIRSTLSLRSTTCYEITLRFIGSGDVDLREGRLDRILRLELMRQFRCWSSFNIRCIVDDHISKCCSKA